MVMYFTSQGDSPFTSATTCYGGSYCTWASLYDAGTCISSNAYSGGTRVGPGTGYLNASNQYMAYNFNFSWSCQEFSAYSFSSSLFASISSSGPATGCYGCSTCPVVTLCLMDKFICTKSTDYVVTMDMYICTCNVACFGGLCFAGTCCYPLCVYFCKVAGNNSIKTCDINGARNCVVTNGCIVYNTPNCNSVLTMTPTKIQLISGSAYWWKCMTF